MGAIRGFLAAMAVAAGLVLPAAAQLAGGPDCFGPRDFPLAVDTDPVKARDGIKDGHLVIYDYRKGDAEAADIFAKYNQIVSVNGQSFETAPDLYAYVSSLPAGPVDLVLTRRVDGAERIETLTLSKARPTAQCAPDTIRNEGIVQGLDHCGEFYRFVTPEQLMSCASTGIVTSFLRARSNPPCGLIGRKVALQLGQLGCYEDRPSWLVMGYAEDPRGKNGFTLHVRSDLSETAMDAAEASAACHSLLGQAVEPWKIFDTPVKWAADYSHFYYLGELKVAGSTSDTEWLERQLKPGVLYMDAETVLFAESATGYESDPSGDIYVINN